MKKSDQGDRALYDVLLQIIDANPHSVPTRMLKALANSYKNTDFNATNRKPTVRSTDPKTSREAADTVNTKVKPGTAPFEALKALYVAGDSGLNYSEAVDPIKDEENPLRKTPCPWRKFTELGQKGLAATNDETRMGIDKDGKRTKNKQQVWVITPAGCMWVDANVSK